MIDGLLRTGGEAGPRECFFNFMPVSSWQRGLGLSGFRRLV